MSGKLARRLGDAARSGLYRAAGEAAILEAAREAGLRVARVALAPGAGKAEILAALARALEFPAWFGANWDALEDCLTDLSWSKAAGHVILVEGAARAAADDVGVLEDVAASAASFWAGRGRPFFVVFLGGADTLPALYRERP
jgi:hypothetical protein